jgi:hypothetical protein
MASGFSLSHTFLHLCSFNSLRRFFLSDGDSIYLWNVVNHLPNCSILSTGKITVCMSIWVTDWIFLHL